MPHKKREFKVLRDVLREEHKEIRKAEIPKDKSLDEIHRERNRSDYAALCLSGGGIRSATFNLGILQGLAQAGMLDRFDYLSTVSGGGFIGSWYSAWKQRDGTGTDLIEPISGLSRSHPQDSKQPEPKPVEHLRSYSNYLSPKVGLLSADFWTLIAVYLRNLCMINVVFLPVIMAFLMVPRIFYSWINLSPEQWRLAELALILVPTIGLVAGFYATWILGQNLPKIGKRKDDEHVFLKRCLLPLAISAACLVSFWGWFSRGDWRSAPDPPQIFQLVSSYPLGSIIVAAVVLLVIPFMLCVGLSSIRAFALVALATLITVALTYAATQTTLWSDTRLYVTFAFPFLFVLMMVAGTTVAAFTSKYTTDNDEEWWARSGAWMMIVMAGWIGLCALVMWIPEYVLNFVELVRERPSAVVENWTNMAKAALPVFGVLSTLLSLFGGFSSATGGSEEDQARGGIKSSILSNATSLLATVALVFILATLAAFTGPLLVFLSRLGPAPIGVAWTRHSEILAESSLLLVLLATIVLAFLAWWLGHRINTNKFSLHYYWRNRIIRAYMGASRDRSKSKTDNPFIRFDPADNLSMKCLRGQRPFHVINIALNLTESKRLKWQERLAESFTVSPLHCGTSWLGYRDSAEYANGSGDGISLGTAVAISGAAASPNMGYMMTSPVVRFLMTLFNIRLGAWMGNPGKHGKLTYKNHAPHNIIRPIVNEALGQTNDDSPYVYLSDGGHFENLGLYEMVLRRCRFIVVSDASTDPDYGYESLAQAIRKIRIDMGVPIDFNKFPLIGRKSDGSGVHFAYGTISYSKADADCSDGYLIYVKPSLQKDEPRDIINYITESDTFPQEPISDQFFSESQFESYRALGFVIANRIFRGPNLEFVFTRSAVGGMRVRV